MEQVIKSTQEGYDDEIQAYNDQIEALRKAIEEAERSLERYTSECRHLAMYQTSLENELDRYKRIIENEDNRLNSAIIGTPITLFTTNYRCTHTPAAPSRGRDITQAIQDITSIKPRQKNLAKKVLKKKDLSARDVTDCSRDDRTGASAAADEEEEEEEEEEIVKSTVIPVTGLLARQDVPDGAQISKAFDTLCNIVRDRMRKYKRPEPIADFYTKGRYVLVTGDGSYPDPCFCTSSPSAGHIFVTIQDGMIMPPYDPPYVYPRPPLPPMPYPGPSDPTLPSDGGDRKGGDNGGRGKDGGGGGGGGGGKGKGKNGDPGSRDPEPSPAPGPAPRPTSPDPNPGDTHPTGPKGHRPMPSGGSACSYTPDSLSYEKVEVLESVEKLSRDRKVKGYEETATVVETIVEKSSKKKPRN
ncbi:Filensin [Merluccius polli]|uniref:Filensin n=1 Tax=Merluccius polli TaxID=89951 RepID=A0AA47P960_MERPO|nr:Filensin [Merluccius polli]